MSARTLNRRYRLDRELGRGGMGVVYHAQDLQLNRPVAVKVLPAEFSHDQQFLQRFRNEVLNAAKLDHPHIVQVHDVGEDEGTHYYVMQLVQGSDLRAQMRHQAERGEAFSLSRVHEVIRAVADALDCAHQHGIIHRDIKPENILLDARGVPKVVDFGIARSLEGTRLTGGMIGTPEYMSPEQARGEDLDGSADQYSLAIVAYEMLTGKTPFGGAGTSPWTVVNKHISVPPPDPRQTRPDLPPAVVDALLRALGKMPQLRFASCREFAEALAREAARQPDNGGTILAPPPPPPPPPPRRVPLTVIGMLAVALFAAGAWILWPKPRTERKIATQPPPPVTTATTNRVKDGAMAKAPSQPQQVTASVRPSTAGTQSGTSGGGSPTLPQPASFNPGEIKALVYGWRDAWVSRDADRQMGYYSETVIMENWAPNHSKLDFNSLYQRKRRLFRQYSRIDIEIANLSVYQIAGGAKAQFVQTFRGYEPGENPPHYQSNGSEALWFGKENRGWKIYREEFHKY